MALTKEESIQHAIQDGCQSRHVICQVWYLIVSIPDLCTITYLCYMDTIYKVAAIFVFQNMQSILNCIILSSYICKPICCLHLFPLILQSIILICLKIVI